MVTNQLQEESFDEGIILPENWIRASISDVCVVLDSRRIPINVNERERRIQGKLEEHLFPYYGATGRVGFIDDYIFDGEYVLVGEDGAPFLDPLKDKAYVVNGKIWVNNHAHVLEAKISPKFLVHYLNQINYSSYVSGTTRLKLNQASLLTIPVVIPPENEQQRIVAKVEELFSELDKGTEYLKTAQEQLKVYRQSVLKAAFEGRLTEEWREVHANQLETADQLLERIQQERENRYQQQLNEWEEAVESWERNGKETDKPSKPQMPLNISPLTEEELAELQNLPAGWCWVKLSIVSEKIQIGPFGSLLHRSDYVEDGIPLINPVHINNQTIEPDRIFTVTQRKLDELSNYVMRNSDIIMARRGEMGRCAVVTEKEDGFLCGSGSLFVRLLPEMNPYYCCQFLSSHRVKSYLSERSIGTTMKNLNQSILNNMPIPLCSFTEQQKVVEELDRKMTLLRETEIEIEENLQKVAVLHQSILKKAFSGRLVAQEPNDEPASSLLERIRAERLAAPKPTRKPSTPKKTSRRKKVVDLISVLQSAKDWLSAQDAFRECGVSDGAETEVIEKLYLELRDLEKEDRIEVERRGDEDWVRIRSTARSNIKVK